MTVELQELEVVVDDDETETQAGQTALTQRNAGDTGGRSALIVDFISLLRQYFLRVSTLIRPSGHGHVGPAIFDSLSITHSPGPRDITAGAPDVVTELSDQIICIEEEIISPPVKYGFTKSLQGEFLIAEVFTEFVCRLPFKLVMECGNYGRAYACLSAGSLAHFLHSSTRWVGFGLTLPTNLFTLEVMVYKYTGGGQVKGLNFSFSSP